VIVTAKLVLWCLAVVAVLSPRSQSADGKIAFYSNRGGDEDVYLMNADGTDVQLLTEGPFTGLCPDLSPDGRRIVFVSRGDGNSDLYLMELATREVKRLTDLPSTERQPRWSPDGKRIALQSNRDGNYEIYTMDADGQNWVRLTHTDAEELWPKWSPDGRQIAFSSMRDGNWEIYIVNADGTGLRRLTNSDRRELNPSWSPDGTRIAFASGTDRRFQLDVHLINVDGTNEIQLTDLDGVEENPIWSPDGTRIAFQTMKDGNFEIYVMDTDGSNWQNLTNDPAHDYWPSWVNPAAADEVKPAPRGLLPAEAVQLQIVCDDRAINDAMIPSRSFSCYVIAGDLCMLFDTGGDGSLLSANLSAAGIDPGAIDIIMMSHCNSDHVGGLPTACRAAEHPPRLVLPGGELPRNLGGLALSLVPAKIDSAKSLAATVEVTEASTIIGTGMLTTGTLGDDIPEQSLIIETDAGPVVVTGCSHPGVGQIVRRAAELTGRPVLMMVGGFHLVAHSAEEIDAVVGDLDTLVGFIAPCHCTGEPVRQAFRERFGDRFVDIAAGSVIRMADFRSDS